MTDDEREPQHGGTKGCPQKKLDTMEGASQVRKRNYSPRRVQWAKKWGWWADRQPVKSKRRGRAKPRDIEEQYIKLFLGGREEKKMVVPRLLKDGTWSPSTRQLHSYPDTQPSPFLSPHPHERPRVSAGPASGCQTALLRAQD